MSSFATDKKENTVQKARLERWIEWLRKPFPFTLLVTPTKWKDPIHCIALPDDEPEEDPALISAYYLSFYE